MSEMNIPTLYPEIEERAAPPGKGSHAYFKRLRDGWIVTHIAHPAAVQDMNFKGYVMMPQYGTWRMPGPGPGSAVPDKRGIPFSPVEEPWRLIFQHENGAAEFTVDQIVAYRWHIRPPYREVTFPQVEGIKIYDFFCPECDKGIFSSEYEQTAVELLRQHLTSQFDKPHSYRPEDLRALGQQIDVDFFAERRVRGRPVRGDGRVLQPETEAEQPMTPTDGEAFLVCNDCGATFAGPKARTDRMRHGKECPAKVAAPV